MGQQFTFPLPRHEAMTLEDFLPADANADAVRWLLHTAPSGWPSHAFVLTGAEGTGKTHLLSLWCERTAARRVTLGAGILQKIVEGTCADKAFALDDADACVGDRAQEEWLQHFYNATKAAHATLLLTAQTPPGQWGLCLPDIETRLKSCASAALCEPDDALVRGLLLKQFRDRQLLIEAGVVDYIAARIERTGAAVRRAVAELDDAALTEGRTISIPFVQKTFGWIASS